MCCSGPDESKKNGSRVAAVCLGIITTLCLLLLAGIIGLVIHCECHSINSVIIMLEIERVLMAVTWNTLGPNLGTGELA